MLLNQPKMENSLTEPMSGDFVKVEIKVEPSDYISCSGDEGGDCGNNMIISPDDIKNENDAAGDSKYEEYNFLHDEIDIKEEPIQAHTVKRVISKRKRKRQKNPKKLLVLSKKTRLEKIPCPLCDVRLSFRSMKGHLEKHESGQDFQCVQCPYRTTNKGRWQTHQLEAHNFRETYKCPECDYTAYTKYHLTRHKTQHYQGEDKLVKVYEKNYKCPECDYVTAHRHALRSHIGGKHGTETLKCNFCDYETKYHTSLRRHTKTQHKDALNETASDAPKSFKCEHCSYQSVYKHNLMLHLKRHVPAYKCNMCSYECAEQGVLVKHMEGHKNGDTNPGLEFINVQTTVNMEDEEDIKPALECVNNRTMYKCPECDYTTLTKCHLTAHLFKHSDVADYKCDSCDFATKHPASLRIHTMRHYQREDKPVKLYEKNFKCQECDYVTAHRHALKSHEAGKHGTVTLNCDFCDYETKYHTSLRRHTKTQHKDALNETASDAPKSFKCEHCSYQSVYKHNLMLHLKRHVPAYKCNMCSYECAEQGVLVKHMEGHKNGDTNPGLEFINVQTVNMEDEEDIKPALECMNNENVKNENESNAGLESMKTQNQNISGAIVDMFQNMQNNGSTPLDSSSPALNKRRKRNYEETFRCEHCEYSTPYKNALKIHQRKHDTAELTKCEHCEYTTKYPTSMSRHMVIQHLNKLPNADKEVIGLTDYKCEVCDYKTYYKNNLKAHMRKHSADKAYKCELCSYETAYLNCFHKHAKIHDETHSSSEFQCDKCAFHTKHEGRMSWHLLKIHKQSVDNAHKCPHCDFSTKTKWRLTIHKQRSLQSACVQCLHCDFKSFYKCDIKRHKKQHYDIADAATADMTDIIEPDKPDTPPYTQTQEQDLILPKPTDFVQINLDQNPKDTDFLTHCETNQIHEENLDGKDSSVEWKSIPVIENRHQDKPFSCSICSYSSRFKACVQRHFQRHHVNMARPFKCNRCDFSTSTKDSLMLHIKRSTLNYPMACNCGQMKTLYKCEYLTHQKIHNEFRCSICPYSCRLKYDLENHYLIHTGAGLKCRFCDYKAIRKHSLLCHEAVHTGNKPFKCSKCDYSSVRASLLDNHIKRSHSGSI